MHVVWWVNAVRRALRQRLPLTRWEPRAEEGSAVGWREGGGASLSAPSASASPVLPSDASSREEEGLIWLIRVQDIHWAVLAPGLLYLKNTASGFFRFPAADLARLGPCWAG